jgi:hypothetical protein
MLSFKIPHPFLLGIIFFAFTPSLQAMQPFEAHYKIYYRGILAARAHHQLSYQPSEGVFHFERQTTPLIAFIPYGYHEKSTFHHKNNKIIPLAFEHQHQEYRTKRFTHFVFEWPTHSIVDQGAEKWPVSLSPGVLDKLSQVLQLQADLKVAPQKKRFSYKVADDHLIKTMVFNKKESAPLGGTPWGKISTVAFEYQSPKNRSTRIWFAVDYGYVPVRMTQYRHGHLQTEARLEHWERHDE